MGKTGCHRHPSCDRLAVMMVTACQLGTASPKLMPKLPKLDQDLQGRCLPKLKWPRLERLQDVQDVQVEELKEGTGPKVKQDNLAGITMRECAWARIALRRTFLPTPPLSLKWTANPSNDAVARKLITSCASPGPTQAEGC